MKWNQHQLNLLAAAVLMKDDNVYRDAMDKAYMLSEEHEEDAFKLMEESGLKTYDIAPFNSLEVQHKTDASSLVCISQYVRENFPKKTDMINLLMEIYDEDGLKNKIEKEGYQVSQLCVDIINKLKEKDKLPSNANGYIGIGMMLSSIAQTANKIRKP